MLARRCTVLLARRLTPAALGAATTSPTHGRRSLVLSKVTAPLSGTALSLQKRSYFGETVLCNLAVHSTQIGGCMQLSTMLYSPLGTAMLVVLAYNVVVICTKHVNYSMEITAKDYVQDQQLYVIMRYGILCCILLGMEVMFVEV